MSWEKQAEELKFRKENPLSWTELYKEMQPNFPGKTLEQVGNIVRGRLRKSDKYEGKKKDGPKPKKEVEESQIDYNKDGSVTIKHSTAKNGQEMTPEYLLKAHGMDAGMWEVTSYKNNMWDGVNGEVNYQSKLTAKPKTQGLDLNHIENFYNNLPAKAPKMPKIKPQGRVMAEINIADLHLGKLCWSGETPENFDHKIARDVYYQLLSDIIAKLKTEPLEYITFVWANDFFNSDNEEQTTTGGTRQDTDARAKKLFDVGTEMLNHGILLLREELKVPVKTFYTRSNHDESTGYHALKNIESFFRLDPNVEVDTSAYPRKYIMYGNSLIGFCHGDKEKGKPSSGKASRLASLMPIEAADMWSKTKWREMHTAHLHSEYAWEEINGVIVRRISSPTPQDKWHTDSGYLGSVRKAQTFLWDKEWGNVGIINTPVR